MLLAASGSRRQCQKPKPPCCLLLQLQLQWLSLITGGAYLVMQGLRASRTYGALPLWRWRGRRGAARPAAPAREGFAWCTAAKLLLAQHFASDWPPPGSPPAAATGVSLVSQSPRRWFLRAPLERARAPHITIQSSASSCLACSTCISLLWSARFRCFHCCTHSPTARSAESERCSPLRTQ